MDYKMIAVDLDGTLYSDEKEILPETAAALKKAAAQGAYIIPSTGRPLMGIPENVLGLGCIEYAVTCNGAAVYNVKSGELLFEEPMECEKASEIITVLKRFDISVDAFINGKAYKERSQISIIDSLALSEYMKNYLRNTRIYVDDLAQFVYGEGITVHKITLNFSVDGRGGFTDRAKTAEYLNTVEGITVVSGGMNNLEITKKGVNKGKSLLKTGELLGVSQSEIRAFGDSGNDIAMINAAGTGVAMANSTPEILAAADLVTRSNNDNGIAYALSELMDI
ncbi:MAG: Cof-type HAD-IIB family hydrolase [Oscillospiraceae bacterium]|nr:Cof-type HAD-IIB family hydrolase [Oscillospiraceae bacterium]